MKTFAKVGLGLVLAAGLSVAGFAQGSTEQGAAKSDAVYVYQGTILPDETTVGSVEVPVNDAIRAYFTAHGIDGSIIDKPIAEIDVTTKKQIDELISNADRKSELDAIIEPLLKAALARGSVEVATLRTGRYEWTMSLQGPEDSDSRPAPMTHFFAGPGVTSSSTHEHN